MDEIGTDGFDVMADHSDQKKSKVAHAKNGNKNGGNNNNKRVKKVRVVK